MKHVTERIEFYTAQGLIDALQCLTGPGIVNLNEIYLKDVDGEELTCVELEQESLGDGSLVFNVILSTVGDPNS